MINTVLVILAVAALVLTAVIVEIHRRTK